jgi:hypothetical protein
MRNASSISHLLNKASCPKNLTKFTTLLMQSYFTVEFSGGISEFTEFPFGKERSCMRPYFPGTDFGD